MNDLAENSGSYEVVKQEFDSHALRNLAALHIYVNSVRKWIVLCIYVNSVTKFKGRKAILEVLTHT